MPSQILLQTPELTLGEFACAPGDPLWGEVNTNMGAWPHVVFPRTHVLIAQDGARPVLTTPNHVVFYRPHQLYRRGLRDPRGDRSLWLEVSPTLLESPPEGPAGPSDPGTYLLAVALARHLVTERSPDRLLAEEAALRLYGGMRGVMVAALGLALCAPASAAASGNGFVEDVRVLQTWRGVPGGYMGWAVSELTDIDRDGVTDVISGEPYNGGGVTWVFSGRTGRTLHRFDGTAGDFQGNAIADAGDTNRDGVHDIISGAPGSAGAGRAYLYSGRTGRLLHTWEGSVAGDRLGSAVAGAGDQNLDGYDDVLVGAEGADAAGVNAGAAYVLSGRTYEVLRRLDGRNPGDAFGSGVDWVEGIIRRDLVVGAQNANGGGGGAFVFAGFTGAPRFSLAPPAGGANFGQFFVAGVGRVDGDLLPDVYAADYGAMGGNGFAGVYSGRDGSLIHAWPGGPGDGRGPGREAGDVDRDGRVDLAVGSYTAGSTQAGRVDVFSGATGRVLRTLTSTTPGENLGFDAVGVGDVNHDGRSDLLLSAAEGDAVYLVAGERRRRT